MSLIKTIVEIEKQQMNSNYIEVLNIQDKRDELNTQYEIYLSRYEACNILVNTAKSP